MIAPSTIVASISTALLAVGIIAAPAADLDPVLIPGVAGSAGAVWIASTVFSAYKRWCKLADSQQELADAQLADRSGEKEHREHTREHYSRVERALESRPCARCAAH